MNGQWFDAHSFHQLEFDDLSSEYRRTRPFLEGFLNFGNATKQERLIANVETVTAVLKAGDQVLPITINDQQLDNSWVCSPYNSVVTYPLEELRHFSSGQLRVALSSLIRSIAPLIRNAQINRVVCVNNYLLSTNHVPSFAEESLRWITDQVIHKYPDHAIMFRSLNWTLNAELMAALTRLNFSLAPSRQVYLYDPDRPEFMQRYNTLRDIELLERSTDYSQVSHEQLTNADDDRLHELYGKLYLEKYSRHNPQFSLPLIRLFRQSNLIEYTALRGPSGSLDGMLGLLDLHGTLTVPLVGYDTALPQKIGLYRRLMARALQLTVAKKKPLNLSAGAGEFKRIRGGTATIEYSAVYCEHLSWKQKIAWKSLALLLEQVGARLLRRFRL